MKDIAQKYKQMKGTKSSKIIKFLLIFLVVGLYVYLLLFWTPQTFATLLKQKNLWTTIRVLIAIYVVIYISLQLDIKFFRALRYSKRHIEDYEFWNKYLLHLTFMKTGSASEQMQVLEVLQYLEDNTYKREIEAIYESTPSIKEAHNKIVEKYPYPHLKTYFAESENALVIASDDKERLKVTTLNIDKYLNDMIFYKDAKIKSYKMTMALLSIVTILLLVIKFLFNTVYINFVQGPFGFLIICVFLIILTKLFISARYKFNKPLVTYGGTIDE